MSDDSLVTIGIDLEGDGKRFGQLAVPQSTNSAGWAKYFKINPIIVEHNRHAAEVMAEMKVPVNDFYALLVNKRRLARGDRFHWTAPAYKILADQAVSSIL